MESSWLCTENLFCGWPEHGSFISYSLGLAFVTRGGNVGENYGRMCRRNICYHYCKNELTWWGIYLKKCVVRATVSAHRAPSTVNWGVCVCVSSLAGMFEEKTCFEIPSGDAELSLQLLAACIHCEILWRLWCFVLQNQLAPLEQHLLLYLNLQRHLSLRHPLTLLSVGYVFLIILTTSKHKLIRGSRCLRSRWQVGIGILLFENCVGKIAIYTLIWTVFPWTVYSTKLCFCNLCHKK